MGTINRVLTIPRRRPHHTQMIVTLRVTTPDEKRLTVSVSGSCAAVPVPHLVPLLEESMSSLLAAFARGAPKAAGLMAGGGAGARYVLNNDSLRATSTGSLLFRGC